jgi:hypothetical protein
MKRNPRLVLLFVTLILCLAPLPSAASSIVRGRLFRVVNGGSYPALGIAVTVVNSQMGRSNSAYTGPDGMYYLYNIPPGTYTLEVWVANPPMTFQIQVNPEGYTDIAPIQVP